MEMFYEEFRKLGYTEIKDTSKYVEFKTNKYSPYERIKISKEDFAITKDCKSGQGNRGWRAISHKEFNTITALIDYWLSNEIK